MHASNAGKADKGRSCDNGSSFNNCACGCICIDILLHDGAEASEHIDFKLKA